MGVATVPVHKTSIAGPDHLLSLSESGPIPAACPFPLTNAS